MEAEVEESRGLATGGPGAAAAEAEGDEVARWAVGAVAARQEANTAGGQMATEAGAGLLILGVTAAEIAAGAQRPPRPTNWDTMTRLQRKNWNQRSGRPR